MFNEFGILFGLLSAVSFGTGDFSGGFITKRTNVLLVLLYSQIVGSFFLMIAIFVVGENFVFSTIFFSAISGICGGIGLLAFYRGLSLGNMGIVAPITGVVTPIIPLLYSFLNLKYSFTQLAGITLALIAIWLVSSTKVNQKVSYEDIGLAIVAGIGFGLFLLFIDFASSPTSVLYPILVARFASITMIFLVTLLV